MTREETVAAILADTDVCDLETVVAHLGDGKFQYVVFIPGWANFAEVAAHVLNDDGETGVVRYLCRTGQVTLLDQGQIDPDPDMQVVPYADLDPRCEVRCLAAPPAFLVQPTGRLRR